MSSLFTPALSILACPMCMSGAGDNVASAANWAILALFVILMFVLGCFLTFIGYLVRRSKLTETTA